MQKEMQMFRLFVVFWMVLSSTALGATISAGYRGQGVHSNMKSNGAVVNFRPIPKLGFSYSYNYATVDLKSSLEDNDDFFGDSASADSVDVAKAVVNRHLHEAQLRWYPMGGSFFLGAGAMTGKFDGTYEETSASATNTRTYKGTTSFSTYTLGNVWEFKNVMLGAEWVGFSQNLSNKIESSGDSAATRSDSDKDYEDALKLLTTSGGVSMVMVHLGLSL
jgi:hypothetical protein